jgi:hypothetical protein
MLTRKMARKKEWDLPEVEMTLHVNGQDYLVTAHATSIENSGIGPYEWWGRMCVDKGVDYIAEYEITSVSRDGWEGKGNLKDIAGEIYDDPDLSAEVLEKLEEAM